MSRPVLAAAVLLVVLPATGPAAGTAAGGSGVELVAVAPNPAARGDPGEHLVLAFPGPTNVTGWSVADGESVATFPNRTVSGRVVATTDPAGLPQPPGNATVVHLVGRLALANAGETIELRGPDGVLASVTYADAPEGERYVRTADGWRWRAAGATAFEVATATDVTAELFVLPDAPGVPLDAVRDARERVLLAAYTFTSARTATALCRAADRGVDVAVIVEGEPIGGVTRRQARVLDDLSACGVPVSVLGGPDDRYAVHHAKYAVLDDRALVLSENWKPAGVGGRSSRGWGVLVDSPAVARALAETFRADAGFRDARPWVEVREGTELVTEPAANGSYPARFPPTTVEVDRVDVLVTPDNAEAGLVGLLDGAERSVAVQQVAIGGTDGPFANATLRAARRGVGTRILLSRAWYVREDNRRLAAELNGLGREEGLPLAARLLRPRSRFRKSHVKGLLVDGEVAVVGSLNWNAYAARENREVLLVLRDPEAAAYYGRVFRADWRGGAWRLPVGFGFSVLLAASVATAHAARTIAFEPEPSAPVAAWPGQSAS